MRGDLKRLRTAGVAVLVAGVVLLVRGSRPIRRPPRASGGPVKIVCVGDSNTMPAPAFEKWCAKLGRELGPRFTTVDRSWWGTTAVDEGTPYAGRYLVDGALELDPDVVILAWGTNDLLHGIAPERIVAAYREHDGRIGARGATALVALTQPFLPEPKAGLNERVRETNEAIRAAFPADRIVDFAAGLVPEDYAPGGVHIFEGAQTKRAHAAALTVRRLYPAANGP
jgi:lysophospholipase L1-like esterase